MKKVCVLALAILMVFGISMAASAASLEIDFWGGSTDLIQGDYDTGSTITLDWTMGEFVNVDIIMADVPEGNGLAIFGWELAFNPATMAISDLDTGSAFGFVFDLGVDGSVIVANASSTSPPDEDVLMVSFVLTCIGDGLDALTISSLGASYNLLADGTDLDSLFPTVLASVNQVPIPGAVWLLGSGLLGLVGLRRRMTS